MDFSNWALNNRKLVSFFVVCMVLGGFINYLDMPKLEDPSLKVKQAMVVCTYPGASAHEVELEVTDKIEKAISEMSTLDAIESQSMADLSIISVSLKTTVPDADVEQEWDMLRRKVANASQGLPSGASTPMVRDDFGDVYGMFYAIKGNGLSDRELSDYAELVKRKVSDLEGIARVDIYGKRQDCIFIELKQEKMSNLGVMPVEVIQTLNNQNKTSYAGYFNNGTRRVRLTVSDRFKNVEDIGNMLIQGHDDEQLRIRDIANVYKDYASPTRNEMFHNGERALGMSIACVADKDVTQMGKEVDELIEELRRTMPVGVEFVKVFNQPERVEDALGTFMVNLLESVIIVVLVLIFSMGFKSGVIIGISLVTIVFGSLLVLSSMDGTLQRVSLAAFILAMGMLVDNAIVIVDGILIDLQNGRPRHEALTAIGRKTAMPLLGATLIAILAFWPIFLSPDTAGVYVRDLFIVIAVSLMLSWILALTHVPIMADQFFSGKKQTAAEDEDAPKKDPYDGRTYRALEQVLRFGLRFRWLTVAIAIGLLVVSVLCYGLLDKAFFPDMEYDQLYMEYKLPEGTNSTQVEKDLREIREYLQKRPEVKDVTTSVGGTPSRYNLMFKKYPIEACFQGPDPAVLHALSDSAMEIVKRSDKVYLPTTDWEPKVPVLTVNYDQQAARVSGLSRADVALSLMAYGGGIPLATFYDGIHAESIYLKCTDDEGHDLERIDDVSVFGMVPNVNRVLNRRNMQKLMSGTLNKNDLISKLIQTIPLKQVANGVDFVWEEPVVMRYNGQRMQRVQFSPRPGVGTEDARAEIAKEIEKLQLPAGYTLLWQGEKKASDQSMRYLFKGFPLAILLMVVILLMLFRDFKKPAIIFCCIPLIFVGVIPSVALSGKSFGFVAIVGVLGLIGMMIKNGIVLMDEINMEIESGIKPVDALIQSSKSRLRPVMNASLTTVLGMIPLLPDAMFGSLAVTIMGGLLVGTLITLIFIPTLYAIFFKIK